MCWYVQQQPATISTHTPREGRDDFYRLDAILRHISTHTPREGRDFSTTTASRKARNFNSHAPRGARLMFLPISNTLCGFQLTRPARGATRRQNQLERHTKKFQLTRPARGATGHFSAVVAGCKISTHTPREGRDYRLQQLEDKVNISTHTPREGRD